MLRTTPEDILRRRIGTSGTNISPARYFATQGMDMFMIWPTPSSADSVSVYYVARPTALSASADTPTDIPSQFHNLVEWKACAEASSYADYQLYRGRLLPTIDPSRWYSLYERGLKDLRKSAAHMGGRRLAPVRIGRRLTVPNRSVDTRVSNAWQP